MHLVNQTLLPKATYKWGWETINKKVLASHDLKLDKVQSSFKNHNAMLADDMSSILLWVHQSPIWLPPPYILMRSGPPWQHSNSPLQDKQRRCWRHSSWRRIWWGRTHRGGGSKLEGNRQNVYSSKTWISTIFKNIYIMSVSSNQLRQLIWSVYKLFDCLFVNYAQHCLSTSELLCCQIICFATLLAGLTFLISK